MTVKDKENPNKRNSMGIFQETKASEQVLKTNSRNTLKTTQIWKWTGSLSRKHQEASIPRHILAKFLDSKEKKKSTIKGKKSQLIQKYCLQIPRK